MKLWEALAILIIPMSAFVTSKVVHAAQSAAPAQAQVSPATYAGSPASRG